MNMAEGQRLRNAEAKIESLERQVADLARRLDDLSKAQRLLLDQVEGKSRKSAA